LGQLEPAGFVLACICLYRWGGREGLYRDPILGVVRQKRADLLGANHTPYTLFDDFEFEARDLCE
jgi:hypothetical protein